jgi:hypothetical protein
MGESRRDNGQRHQGQAGLERRIAQHVLEPERQGQDQAKFAKADNQRCDVAVGKGRNAEQRQVKDDSLSGGGPAPFLQHKGRQRHGRHGKGHRHRGQAANTERRIPGGTPPAVTAALNQPEDQGAEPEDGQQRTVDVQPLPRPGHRFGGLGNKQQQAGHNQRSEGNVDAEGPPPARVLRQPAAQQRTDGSHAANRRSPDREGDAPLASLEIGVEQRQRSSTRPAPAEPARRSGRHRFQPPRTGRWPPQK